MARHFAPIKTSIWDDPEFQALNSEEQRLYLMLFSQSGISSVGLVPMTLKRWANSTRGMTIKALSKTLQGLSDALFIVVDWDREELLVRSFVRHDGGYTNSLRLKAIQRESRGIGSKLLAGVLAHELTRLGIEHAISEAPYDARSKGHRSPIEGVSKGAGSGYVSTVGDGTLTEPETRTGNREPGPAPLASGIARPTRIPEPFVISEEMLNWASTEVPGIDIKRTTDKFVDYWRGATKNATKSDWPATWRNWLRRDFEEHPPRINGRAGTSSRIATSDQRVADGLDVVRRLAAQEEQANHRMEIEA